MFVPSTIFLSEVFLEFFTSPPALTLKILPSFAPGYYEPGNGKDLGMALEFKSEIKFNLNIFKDSKIGYSYSHISNNDWGKKNPGIDNQQISFSKNF